MKLKNISIQNFRSITSTERLELSNYCILLGKNNEGKTNVLKAISFAMHALMHARFIGRRVPRRSDVFYSYKRDYPVSLLGNPDSKPTKFILTFLLDDSDIIEFYKSTSLHNNGKICIEIDFPKSDDPYERPKINIKEKRGRGGKSYKNNIQNILDFLLSNISFQYIPAVRTADDSFDVIRGLIRNVIYTLDDDEEYKNAVDLIAEKRNNLINDLGPLLKEKIKTFIPSVVDVEISLVNSNEPDFGFADSIKFVIDDGNKTSIQYKGDGIKSLAALALLYNTKSLKQSQIIAIEEPESHLHYEAIHQIDAVLKDLSKTNQVVVTTHNPIFINKDDISSNIIIDKGIGKKASSLKEIRDLMGIRISDSLFYSDRVILVEGENDKTSFAHIFSLLDDDLKKAIDNKSLTFSVLDGASKLPFTCSLLSNWLVKYCVILDHDKEGLNSYSTCLSKGLINAKNSFVPPAYDSKKDNEFEDFLNVDLYSDYIFREYGVDLKKSSFLKKKKKWSERLCLVFRECGKTFDDLTKEKIKKGIAELVIEQNNIDAIFPAYYKTVFENIVQLIKKELIQL